MVREWTARRKGLSLAWHLVGFGIALLLPTLLFSGLVLYHFSQTEKARIEENARQTVRQAAELIDRDLTSLVAMAQALAASPVLLEKDIEPFYAQAKEVARLQGGDAILRDPSGQIMIDTRHPVDSLIPPAISIPLDLDEKVRQMRKPLVSDLAPSPFTKNARFAVSVPIMAQGEVIYTLSLILNPERLFHILKSQNFPASWDVGLIDGQGLVLTHMKGHEVFSGRRVPDRIIERTRAKEGTGLGAGSAGQPVFYAYQRLNSADWFVALGIPRQDIEAPLNRSLWALGTMGAVLLALSLTLAFLYSRLFAKPLHALASEAVLIGQGKTVDPSFTLLREANEVAEVLSAVSIGLRERTQALRHSKERLEVAQEAAGTGGWEWIIKTATASCTPGFLRLLGVDPSTPNTSWHGFLSKIHADDRQKVEQAFHDAARAGSKLDVEFRVPREDRTMRYFQIRGRTILNEHGLPERLAGVIIDVTDRQQRETDLASSEARFRSVYEQAAVGIERTSLRDGRILDANSKLCTMLGYPLQELTQRTFIDLTHPADRATEEALIARMQAGEITSYAIEKRYIRKDQSLFWARITSSLGHAEGQEAYRLSIIENIEDQKKAEAALAASEERYRLASAAFKGAVYEVDVEAGFIDRSPAVAELIGMPANDLAPNVDAWLSRIHPDDIGRMREAMATMYEGSAQRFEVEYRVRHMDGRWVWIWQRSLGLRDDNGVLKRVIGNVVDISDIKEREDRIRLLMRETLHRSKNQLTIIQVMARQTAKASETMDEFTARFSERLQGLSASQDLLVKKNWEGIPIHDLIRSQLGHYAGDFGERIVMKGPPVLIKPEPAQNLGLAFHELASNATKYGALSSPKGQIFIEWTISRFDNQESRFQIEWREQQGPEVLKPGRRGFGSTVLERIAAGALDGKVNVEFAKQGLIWRLEGSASYLADIE